MLPVMADDSTTPEKDGFSANEQLTWYYQTESGDVFLIELNPSSLFVVNAVSYITSVSISEVLCDGGSTGAEGDCPSLIFDAFNTGSNMTLFLTPSGASALSALGNGTIGVYFQNSEGSEVCGGSASFNGAQVQVTAYADDSTTPEKDGFAAGESITWKFQDNIGNQFNLIPEPEDVFVINATSFISSMSYSAITCLAEEVLGCTDQNAFNYDSSANTEDGSCIAVVYGCTDSNALNYDSNANTDDGSCIAVIGGCTDPSAFNYNSNANTDDGSCVEGIEGCTDLTADNYDDTANTDNGSCEYTGIPEDCPALSFDAVNTGANMTLFLVSSAADELSMLGDGNIGVYFIDNDGDESCGGSASFNGAQVQVTAYADDSTTPEKDGFAAGESITWKFQDNIGNQFNLIPEPEDVFVINATSFISSMSYSAITCLAEEVLGCTDQNAFNYDSSANTEDGSCIAVVYGCTDSNALNYDSNANTDDGSCIAVIGGCTDPSAFNYNSNANTDDGSCVEVIEGCIDISASNYDASANTPDNSCISWEEAYQNCVSSGGIGEFSQSDIDDAYQSGFLAADDGIGQAQLDAQADISYSYGYGEGFAAADDGIGQTELDAQADLSYGYGYGEGYDEGVNVSSGSCETIFIDLISGWNIIGYTLPFPQDITATLSSIVDNINIMKNNDADVFWPEYGFNGIGDFIPGQGYQILMLNSISEYSYPDVSGERVEMTPTVPYWAHDLPILCHPNDSRSLVKVINMLGQEVDIKSQFKGELLLHLYSDGTVEKHLVE